MKTMKHLKLRAGAFLGGFSFLLFATASFGQAISPVITSVTPDSAEPGMTVQIDGRGLTTATAVLFNGVPADPGNFFGLWLFAIVPANATSGPITVVTPTGTAVSEFSFTVRTPDGPEITSVYPLDILAAPNRSFTVDGRNLQHVTEVRIGTTPLQFGGSIIPGALNVNAPLEEISGKVTVITPYGTATSKEIVTAKLPGGPVVTDFSPKSGPVDTEVILAGTNLEFVSAVKLGDIDLNYLAGSGVALPVFMPTNLVSAPFRIISPYGETVTSDVFTVTPPEAPQISSIAPNGYDELLIFGRHLRGIATVRLNGVECDRFLPFYRPTQMIVTIPPGPTGGTGIVSIESNFGTNTFSVVLIPRPPPPQPSIQSFDPTDSPPGNPVLIRGFYLRSPSEVRFNGVPSPEIRDVSFPAGDASSLIRAIVPTNASSGPITVVSPSGEATSAKAFRVSSDVSLQVDQLPLFLAPGETGSFSLTITNCGFADVRGSILKSRLAPAARITAVKTTSGISMVGDGEVTVTVPSLKAQSTETVTITLEALPEGSAVITSEVVSNDIDPFPENNRHSGFIWTIDPGRHPPLVIDRRNAKLLRITWPTLFADYDLEFAESLNLPDGWSKADQAPSLDGNRNVIHFELPDVSDGGFFRLKK
jgi:hypothetical protein